MVPSNTWLVVRAAGSYHLLRASRVQSLFGLGHPEENKLKLSPKDFHQQCGNGILPTTKDVNGSSPPGHPIVIDHASRAFHPGPPNGHAHEIVPVNLDRPKHIQTV